MSSSVLAIVRENRQQLKADLEALAPRLDLSPAEVRQFDTGCEQLKAFDERIAELEADEKRQDATAAHNRELGVAEPGSGWSVGDEPEVYRDPARDPRGSSFFLDLRNARLGGWDASDRLKRSEKAAAVREKRAGDLSSSTAAAMLSVKVTGRRTLLKSADGVLRPMRIVSTSLIISCAYQAW